MALIDCPECGRQVSDQAAVCPECAYPIRGSAQVAAQAPPTAPMAAPPPPPADPPVLYGAKAAPPSPPPPTVDPNAPPILYGSSAPSSKPGIGRMILIGLGGLVALGVVASLVSPKSPAPVAAVLTPTLSVAQAAAPTAAPKPTDAPKPTSAPPTVAPAKPTAVPATAKPQVPADIQAYMLFLGPKFTALSSTIKTMTDLSTQGGSNAALLQDAAFKARLKGVLATLKTQGQDIQKYDPVPPRLKALDDQIVSIGKDMVFVADEYTAGLDALNATRITNASTRMVTAAQKMTKVTAEINAVSQELGL